MTTATQTKMSQAQATDGILASPLPATREERKILIKEATKIVVPLYQPKWIATAAVVGAVSAAAGLGLSILLRRYANV